MDKKVHTSERRATKQREPISCKLDLKHRGRTEKQEPQKEASEDFLELTGNVQIARSEFKGVTYCDIRKVYGEKKTRKGVTLSMEQLKELLRVGPELLRRAKEERGRLEPASGREQE